MILTVIYSLGLRVGELLELKLADFDKARGCVHIRHGKGNKDRIIPVSESLLKGLREYYIVFTPEVYVFEGQQGPGTPYSNRSIQAFQVLLGHNSLKTTQIYTHLTDENILATPSPLDFLY